MSIKADSQHALELLEKIQTKLQKEGDRSVENDIANLIYTLESPLFNQLLNIQDAIHQLKQVNSQQPLSPDEFDFDTSNGELVLHRPEGAVPSPEKEANFAAAAETIASVEGEAALQQQMPQQEGESVQEAIARLAQNREVSVIELNKPDDASLGFTVVSLRSDTKGELGIFVQSIQPDSIAARDGRLQENDQILAIDGHVLDASRSNQEAIGILQRARGKVVVVVAGQQHPSASSTLDRAPGSAISEETSSDMVLSTEWTQLEVIDLLNDGTGLGFGIIGGKSTGVVVKTILPGGVADKEGRMRSGDHMLQIGDVNVRGMSSDQVASVLRQSGAHVRLIVARSLHEYSHSPHAFAPVVPTHQLDEHLHTLNHNLMALDRYEDQHVDPLTGEYIADQFVYQGGMDATDNDPEVESIEVQLVKDSVQGLGITIAGYVAEKQPDDLSGIFVRSIAPGSTAYEDGRVQVNDQIIAVDGQPLEGFSNQQAVEVLRNTGHVVTLKLARYRHGPKYEQLQTYALQALQPSSQSASEVDVSTAGIQQSSQQVYLDEIKLQTEEDYSTELSPEVEEALITKWQPRVGDVYDIVVAQLSKFREGGGLGISLEGTVDVENGQEVRPHHYIRSVLSDGPVGINGKLQSGDELLEVNGITLLGLNHKEVVTILKELPQHVRIICGRRTLSAQSTDYALSNTTTTTTTPNNQIFQNTQYTPPQGFMAEMAQPSLVKANSEGTLFNRAPYGDGLNKNKSQSLEPLNYLATWGKPQVIELQKGDRGLGFSILDYENPTDPSSTIIVIRSLVPGGVAHNDGRLVPGDRLVSVNETNLENATLDQAVAALKGATRGTVYIGVAKALPTMPEIGESSTDELVEEEQYPPVGSVAPDLTQLPMLQNLTASNTQPIQPVQAATVHSAPIQAATSDISINSLQQSAKTDTERLEDVSVDEAPSSPPPPPPPSSPPHETLPSPPSAYKSSPPSTLESSSLPYLTPLATASALTTNNTTKESPVPSPSLSQRSTSSSVTEGLPPLPAALERTIKIKKGNDTLGLTVDSIERGVNGCIVRSIQSGSAIEKDGRIQIGDYIVSINNENMRRITNTQARVILRRASLSSDISVGYISQADAMQHRDIALTSTPPPTTNQLSPNSTLDSPRGIGSLGSTPSPPGSPAKSPQRTPEINARLNKHKLSKELSTSNPMLNDDLANSWGSARLVEVHRKEGESLGISIVGGRVDLFNVSPESQKSISGIFIKDVLESSPAGRSGDLKTGDRILEVDGEDLRDATHDKAVEVIKHSSTTVRFLVQSLVDPWPTDKAQTQEVTINKVSSSVVDQPPVPTTQPPQDDEEENEDEWGYTWEKVLSTYGDLKGTLHMVEFERGQNGLGLSLAGNRDLSIMSIFVAGIQPNSPTAVDGRIKVADQLLEINGQVLFGRSHLNASAIIKSVTAPKVKLIILRQEDDSSIQMAVKPLKLPPVEFKNDPNTLISPEKYPSKNNNSFDQEPEVLNGGTNHISVTKENHVAPPPESHDLSKYKHVCKIQLQKGSKGLGFAIEEKPQGGERAILVRTVTPDGPAAAEGGLSVGDHVLLVDDKSLIDVSYDKAIDLMRSCKGTVQLTVNKTAASELTLDTKAQNSMGAPSPSSPKPPPSSPKPSHSPKPPSSPNVQRAKSPEQKEDPATCQIVPGKEIRITIQKGKTGLGLSIVGGADTLLNSIIVHEVYPEGAAAKDSRLWAGDQILEVNHEDLRDATHDRAIQVLRQTPSVVEMLVFRDETLLKDEEIYDIFTVELLKKPNKGLGLSIVGRRNDKGVFISDIVKGGAAEADGKLLQGDQILEVNGKDMKNSTQEDAAATLKTLMGKVVLKIGRLKGSRSSSRRNSSQSSHSERGLKKSDSNVSSNKSKSKHSKTLSQDSNRSSSATRTVELTRGRGSTFGLSIAGGLNSPLGDAPLTVAAIMPNSAAEECGQIHVGDHILNVNSKDTARMQHQEVVDVLKNAVDSVTLVLAQGEDLLIESRSPTTPQSPSDSRPPIPDTNSDMDLSSHGKIKEITLIRGQDGLGFSVIGGYGSPHGDLPIYVKTVFARGAAAEEGSLQRGDQILAVDGNSLEGVSHEQAVTLLKKAQGTINLTVLS